MKRPPLVATLVVALAVAAMIALGLWQLQRRGEKEAALSRYAANVDLPPVAFPRPGTGQEQLFRRASLTCLRVTDWQRQSGRAADGTPGWRMIATCATGIEGPGTPVQLGVARAPDAKLAWGGGAVTGFITYAPDRRPLLARMFDHRPTPLMLVAAVPPAGLAANPGPDLSGVPNNHLAYAVQWFLFAGVAVVVYVVALRRRG